MPAAGLSDRTEIAGTGRGIRFAFQEGMIETSPVRCTWRRIMRNRRLSGSLSAALLLAGVTTQASAQATFNDAATMIQFQRSADAYAFLHRQVQRRIEDPADRNALAEALRRARPTAGDGDFFTPVAADAFRKRLAAALALPGCHLPPANFLTSEVPRVGARSANALGIPGCVALALPALPEELEYRVTGVVLLLVDGHADVVVDVLHAAFQPHE